jgi:hypothetical protein
MMCGCMIDNLFWPAADFNVQAIISHAGKAKTLPLSYTGAPAYFRQRILFRATETTKSGLLPRK